MADSRFRLDKFIVDLDKSFIQANIKELKEKATNTYIVPAGQAGRMDLISYTIYRTVDLKWLLMYVNDIIDISAVGFAYRMKYPTLADVTSVLFQTVENT